jgi:chromosome segregation ATPase
LKKIAELAENINVKELQQESDTSRTQAQSLESNVNRVSLYLPGMQADINATKTSIEANQNKLKQLEESVQSVVESNDAVQAELNNVSLNVSNLFGAYLQIFN